MMRRGARAAGRRAGRRAARRTVRRQRRRIRRRRVMLGGFVLLAAGGTAAAIKLSKKDADRIEEHAGMPVEDMTDEDLNEAMDELGIQAQAVDASDQAALAEDGGAEPAPAPEAAPPAAATAGSDYIEELKRLAELRDAGIISDEDFEAKKKLLLGL